MTNHLVLFLIVQSVLGTGIIAFRTPFNLLRVRHIQGGVQRPVSCRRPSYQWQVDQTPFVSLKALSKSTENDACNLPWLDVDQMLQLSKKLSISVKELEAQHIDVSYYDTSLEKSFFHVRQRSINNGNINLNNLFSESHQEKLSVSTSSYNPNLNLINEAAIKTFNWCSEFVLNLNLCPWAKQSLLSNNAIRLKVVDQHYGWYHMEQIVRESSLELKALTGEGIVDPYIGITFVIAIPNYCNKDDSFDVSSDVYTGLYTFENDDGDFDFLQFYENFSSLEEEFMDDYHENGFSEVTIAPFHPEWTFASPTNEFEYTNKEEYHDENVSSKKYEREMESKAQQQDPLDYEKRTPYPTISIVMAKGIDLAGEETTAKIGEQNEATLTDLGYDMVKQIYHEEVLRKKSSSFF